MANIQLSSESAQAYVGYAASVVNSNEQTMTSLQIAEVTGKTHSNVMRDIRNLLEQLENKAQFSFELGSYQDANGQNRPCYILTKKDCLLLASGYDANLRAKIILRWEQLEYRLQEQTLLQDRIIAAKFAAEFLNLNEVSKLQMAKAILDPLGLPAPDYVPSKGVMHSAKELLKINGVNMSAQSLNKALAKAGILKQHTRPGKGGKIHKWYVITDSGERFGENGVCPQNPKQTQPLWYDNSFTELVSVATRELA